MRKAAFGIVVVLLLGCFAIGLVRSQRRLDSMQDKAAHYDLYCEQLRLVLRDMAAEMRRATTETREDVAFEVLHRLEARYASDDVMSCGAREIDLRRFRACYGRGLRITDSDRDCLVDVLTEAETAIPPRRPEHE